VWKGLWDELDVVVRVIVIDDPTPEVFKKLEQQITQVCEFRHPHILLVYGVCVCSATELWVVMEYAEDSIESISGSQAVADVSYYRWYMEAASALAHLHQHRVIHKHVKSSNLLIFKGVLKMASDNLITAGNTKLQVEESNDEESDVYSLVHAFTALAEPITIDSSSLHLAAKKQFEEFRNYLQHDSASTLTSIIIQSCAQQYLMQQHNMQGNEGAATIINEDFRQHIKLCLGDSHVLTLNNFTDSRRGCDICLERIEPGSAFKCTRCLSYDVCVSCYKREHIPTTTSLLRLLVVNHQHILSLCNANASYFISSKWECSMCSSEQHQEAFHCNECHKFNMCDKCVRNAIMAII